MSSIKGQASSNSFLLQSLLQSSWFNFAQRLLYPLNICIIAADFSHYDYFHQVIILFTFFLFLLLRLFLCLCWLLWLLPWSFCLWITLFCFWRIEVYSVSCWCFLFSRKLSRAVKILVFRFASLITPTSLLLHYI